MPDAQFCPICAKSVPPMPRYPHYVCGTCAAKVVTADGRPVLFFNFSLSGGIGARYADTGETYDSLLCYIDGVVCLAEEAHLGGVVIQVMA